MPARSPAVEFRRLTPAWEEALTRFFLGFQAGGDDKYFHPHPLTASEAGRLARYGGDDLYYVLVEGEQVLAYGMLRGWDEGFETPSVGVAVHPSARGQGLGELFMRWLHLAALRRGAVKVRLKVYEDNERALRLYRRLGYRFTSVEDGQLVGEYRLR